MKKLITLAAFIFTLPSFAALEDARSMTQVTRGTWKIKCQDLSIMQVSTQDILNQHLCGTTTIDPQACFDATVIGMKTFDYDDLSEIKEINQYCSQGDIQTDPCISETKKGLKTFDYDDRSEGIELIKACTQGIRRGHINMNIVQCIQASTKGLKTFEYDDRNEIIEIVQACGIGNSQTYRCIQTTTDHMRSFDYDDRDEILAVIKACY